jgi:hypothetical protein
MGKMNKQFVIRAIEVTFIVLTAAAIAQELSKPKKERRWHGTVMGFIPYDFRFPTLEKFKETYWNPYERHVLTLPVFGVGWTVNFYALFENLGFINPADISEESFLMPNESIRHLMKSQVPNNK